MALLDHNGESEFPFSKDLVFDALCKAIPTINGMKIETADKLSGRVVVKAGVSLHSWGENIPIQLSFISEDRTQIKITSSPKTGIMFGGAMDMGKNRKNIEQILLATSASLSNQPQSDKAVYHQNSHNTNNYKSAVSYFWYEKTWLVVLLCIVLFPIGLYGLWKNSSISKGWKIAVTIFIGLVVIANIGSKDKKASLDSNNVVSTEKESSDEVPVKKKQWKEVYTFKGNGMKKSSVFELAGGDTRLKYSYNGKNGVGMGLFTVYVVDEGEDIMKTGGIPEVMTQAEKEESETSLQKSEGRYYLNVNAVGNWVVIVEELK